MGFVQIENTPFESRFAKITSKKSMSLLLRIQRNVWSFSSIMSLGQTKVFQSVPQRYWDLGGRFMLDTRPLVDHLLYTAGNKWSIHAVVKFQKQTALSSYCHSNF